jgi:hypothetical protein
MQAVIAYELQHVDERERTGFIDRGGKEEGEVCDDDQPPADSGEQIVKWRE